MLQVDPSLVHGYPSKSLALDDAHAALVLLHPAPYALLCFVFFVFSIVLCVPILFANIIH